LTTTSTEVDVVILTWNDGALLDAAVGSALTSVGVTPRVIVVDNGSVPPAVVTDDERVTVLRNPQNAGVAGGRNQGVAAGSSPFVCLLDSDARLEPDCLRAFVDGLATDLRIGIAVPVFVDQRPDQTAGLAPTFGRKVLRLMNLRDGYAPAGEADGDIDGALRDVDFGIGACQLFRREAFDSVHGLDEAYFYGPEDVDFCLRVRKAGWRVVQMRAARCNHPPRRRNRRLLTRRGIAHAGAVMRHLWRHRGHARAER
jgi:GT2 family glycosyltransferase